MLFDKGKPPSKPRQNPRKLMHVYDCGQGEDEHCLVVMQCRRCDLRTGWFTMPTVTEAKRGITCPKCSGLDYERNEHSEYEVGEYR